MSNVCAHTHHHNHDHAYDESSHRIIFIVHALLDLDILCDRVECLAKDQSTQGEVTHTQRERERERERDQEAVEESGTERKREMRFTALVTLICVILSVQSGVHATNFLFVQTATGATLNGTLTMTGVTKDVTYFSDRPVRVAGIMSTEEFLAFYEPNRTFYEV